MRPRRNKPSPSPAGDRAKVLAPVPVPVPVAAKEEEEEEKVANEENGLLMGLGGESAPIAFVSVAVRSPAAGEEGVGVKTDE